MEEVSIFHLTENKDELIVGSSYLLLAVLPIPFVVLLAYVLCTDKEFNTVPMYRMLAFIHILDSVSLIPQAIGGIFAIFPQTYTRLPYLNSFCGAWVNSLWLASCPAWCVLSISRVLIMTNKQSNVFIKVILRFFILFFIFYVFSTGVWCFLHQNMVFSSVSWGYNDERKGSEFLGALEPYMCYPCLLTAYAAYLCIFAFIKLTKAKTSHAGVGREEWVVLGQATFSISYMMVVFGSWHLVVYIMEDAENIYTECFCQCVWIIFPYIHPIIMITLNKRVREKFVARLCCQKDDSSVAVASLGGSRRATVTAFTRTS